MIIRPQALRRHLFLELQGQILHRRRMSPRRRRLLLDHRTRRRRDKRGRPSHGHCGSGIRARGPSQGLGGCGRRLSPRCEGPGHLLLRHADGWRERVRCAEDRVARLGEERDRPNRLTRPDPIRAGITKNQIRQDHAPHPTQDSRGRFLQSRRYLDTGRSCRGRGTCAEAPEPLNRLAL